MTFAEDHAAGLHQIEIIEIMGKLDPCFHGHSRHISVIALLRMVAVMLGPASEESREDIIDHIPETLHSILKKMDQIKLEMEL